MKKLLLVLLVLCMIAPAFAEAPAYTGEPRTEITDTSFVSAPTSAGILYFPLDFYGRAVGASGVLGPETMASNYRQSAQNIKPTGWEQERYSSIPGESLYQRCHLIASQLGGAEIYENIVTGTQYMNMSGMLPIENKIAEYIQRTGNHVRYTVLPYYEGDNAVCSGIVITAQSVEDAEINICVYCHNVQPGIQINYSNGRSFIPEEQITRSTAPQTYILNTNRKRFHFETCNSVKNIKPENKSEFTGDRQTLINMGYKPCGECNP